MLLLEPGTRNISRLPGKLSTRRGDLLTSDVYPDSRKFAQLSVRICLLNFARDIPRPPRNNKCLNLEEKCVNCSRIFKTIFISAYAFQRNQEYDI